VIENLLAAAPPLVQPFHYRSAGGAELDLLLEWPDGRRWAVEIKRSLDPRPRKGFHTGRADTGAERGLVVYPGDERYSLNAGVEALALREAMTLVAAT